MAFSVALHQSTRYGCGCNFQKKLNLWQPLQFINSPLAAFGRFALLGFFQTVTLTWIVFVTIVMSYIINLN